jgi:adenylate kinase
VCGAPLTRRTDDNLEALAERMRESAEKTEPLNGFYARKGLLRAVDATQTPDQVFSAVVRILEGA